MGELAKPLRERDDGLMAKRSQKDMLQTINLIFKLLADVGVIMPKKIHPP